MVKVVIAPDSFKECMTAQEAATAIEKGFQQVFEKGIVIDKIPMADGGEGTTQSLADALNGKIYTTEVTAPMGQKVMASYAVSGDKETAIMEMAEASGLSLVPAEERNPLTASTYGTGELIKAALDHNVSKIIIGIGGSATNDGGAGMIKALGGKLLDHKDNEIEEGGAALKELSRLDLEGLDPRLKHVNITVACDVTNPLTGPKGASAVYGPQKGATEEMVEELDEALKNFGMILETSTGKPVSDIPGAGAAGGLGAGLLACLQAELESGVTIALQETSFHDRVKDADLVITGEGKIDSQTIYGKTPIGVAQAAKKHGCYVVALCGKLEHGYEPVLECGIDAAFSLVPGPVSLDDAMKHGEHYLEDLSRNIAAIIKLQM
ncbi:glycerate kinase [Bacillus sp. FJAT-44742]|uniref:glycerate kinase n=1 Tax=Bacillus sp. FJAT-44742 TaxID=2014005 RepID=UPI000C24EB74|nr:glycerate kinase [Bacillus sp. FJAT-44742]